MAVRKYRPITPGQRHRISVVRTELTKGITPEASLLVPTKQKAGRNSQGRRTMRYRGGGHKRKYRIIDFQRNKDGIAATVKTIEYDPNRSAYISLVEYADGEKRYIIGVAPEVGNTMLLSEVPLGATIHNIEMRPGQGGVLARTAGASATMMGREERYASIRMPSGEMRRILLTCRVTIGVVSNQDHSLEVMGKAGRKRWKGIRPRTRPVAMNPVDHPMGGGEGRASGGHPRSRNGIMAKGQKTRYKKKASNALIISRRKSSK
jgi:large subunit ribosomal protein L2